MTKRKNSIKIEQPTTLNTDQLRAFINNSIYEGDCTITVANVAGGKKDIAVTGDGWGMTAKDVPEDFEIIPQPPMYVGRISNMDKP